MTQLCTNFLFPTSLLLQYTLKKSGMTQSTQTIDVSAWQWGERLLPEPSLHRAVVTVSLRQSAVSFRCCRSFCCTRDGLSRRRFELRERCASHGECFLIFKTISGRNAVFRIIDAVNYTLFILLTWLPRTLRCFGLAE